MKTEPDEYSSLVSLFEEGDITAKEFIDRIATVHTNETTREIHSSVELLRKEFKTIRLTAYIAMSIALILLVVVMSTHLFSGYKYAEECYLDAKHPWAVSACDSLYPSINAK